MGRRPISYNGNSRNFWGGMPTRLEKVLMKLVSLLNPIMRAISLTVRLVDLRRILARSIREVRMK